MYATKNFKTKKALRVAVDDYNMKAALFVAGAELKPGLTYPEGVTFYQPGDHKGDESTFTGTVCLEGPHSPAAHTWYAQCVAVDGKIVRVK